MTKDELKETRELREWFNDYFEEKDGFQDAEARDKVMRLISKREQLIEPSEKTSPDVEDIALMIHKASEYQVGHFDDVEEWHEHFSGATISFEKAKTFVNFIKSLIEPSEKSSPDVGEPHPEGLVEEWNVGELAMVIQWIQVGINNIGARINDKEYFEMCHKQAKDDYRKELKSLQKGKQLLQQQKLKVSREEIEKVWNKYFAGPDPDVWDFLKEIGVEVEG